MQRLKKKSPRLSRKSQSPRVTEKMLTENGANEDNTQERLDMKKQVMLSPKAMSSLSQTTRTFVSPDKNKD